MIIQSEIFASSSPVELQDAINSYCHDMDLSEIIDIKFACCQSMGQEITDYTYTAMIIYKTKN